MALLGAMKEDLEVADSQSGKNGTKLCPSILNCDNKILGLEMYGSVTEKA